MDSHLDSRHFAALTTMPLDDLKRALAHHRALLPKYLALGSRRLATDYALIIARLSAELDRRPAPAPRGTVTLRFTA